MNYKMTKPCDACPFRKGTSFSFTPSRARELAMQDAEFVCHKTGEVDEDSEGIHGTDKSAHCAGFLIFREKMNMPTQMMRICERLGFYDAAKLMADKAVTDQVYGSLRQFVDGQKRTKVAGGGA